MKDTSGLSLQTLSRPSVLGGVLGAFLIVSAVALSTNHFIAFFSLEGLMIVIGGVMAVAFMSFHANDVHEALRAIRNMFREASATHDNLHHDMADILAWARIVREKGMRGLESNIGRHGVDDPFVNYGLNMVISDYTPEEIRSMMETAADAYYERDSVPAQVLQAMASHAPAFGMVGTLVGMVTMLYNLGDNVTGIGASLAVSFLSTLYGVVTARMIYMPAAAKLTQKLDSQRFRNQLITEGMVMLVSNKSSIYIQDRLNSFLRPEIHDSLNTAAYDRTVQKLQVIRT